MPLSYNPYGKTCVYSYLRVFDARPPPNAFRGGFRRLRGVWELPGEVFQGFGRWFQGGYRLGRRVILRISAPDGVLGPRQRIQGQTVGGKSSRADPEVVGCSTIENTSVTRGLYIFGTRVSMAWHISAGLICYRRCVPEEKCKSHTTPGPDICENGTLRIYRKISI
jgi:hypothetical protein